MSISFNVLTEGWIPVLTSDGSVQKKGILDVLKNAAEYKSISDASPVVEYSLYRFLGVLLMDAIRPEDTVELEEILEDGSFDDAVIDKYIAACISEGVSFDLFDKERPFLQTPYNAKWDKETKPVTILDCTIPGGNNHTHFDHRNNKSVIMAYDEAARLLLPAQLFCTAGAQGYPSNVSASPPYYTIAKGENLFRTLVYSMCVLDRIDIPFDNPPVIWRNKCEVEPKKEIIQTSWLYGMLFPARRITLVPGENGVSEVYLCQGLNYKSKETWDDPFVTYRYNDDGRIPWRPNGEKAVWRNLDDIIKPKGNYVLKQYFELEKEKEIATISLYGVQTNQASYLGMYHYDLTIPVQLTRSEEHISCIGQCIAAAEELEKALRHSLNDISEIPVSSVSQASRRYYELCEREFWKLCSTVLNRDDADLNTAIDGWIKFIESTVWAVRGEVTGQLRLSGRAMAKTAGKEKEIYYSIKKLRGE